jgi:hypothetical protein
MMVATLTLPIIWVGLSPLSLGLPPLYHRASSCIVSRLVYIGFKAYVRELRRLNTANPEGLVRRRYVVGKEGQTSSNIKVRVLNS